MNDRYDENGKKIILFSRKRLYAFSDYAYWHPLPLTVFFYVFLLGFSVFYIEHVGDSTQLDELFIVGLFPLAALGVRHYRRLRSPTISLILIYYITIVISSLVVIIGDNNDHIPMLAPLVGMILDAKIFIFFLALAWLSRKILGKVDVVVLKLCNVIIFVAAIHLLFIVRDIYSGVSLAGFELGINSIWGYTPIGLFSHKSEVALLLGLADAASLTLFINKRKIIYLGYFLVFFVALAFASSLKEFLAAIIMTTLIATVKSVGDKNRATNNGLIYMLVLTGLVGIIFVFSSYVSSMLDARAVYLTEETVRVRMYKASCEIAINHLPLGSGAGTFGSYPSRVLYYSPLYEQYGLSSIYGGSESFASFLMDAWWPKVIAEAGFFGGLAYILIFLIPFFQLVKDFLRKKTPANTFGLLLGILLLLTSTASAVFTHSLGVLIAALFLLMYTIDKPSISFR